MEETQKVSASQKIIYACGDVALGGTFNIINLFYPIFLASIVQLSPFLTALVILLARLYDAFTDPIMGYLSDKTTSKYGRRRPYIFIGTLFLLLSYILLFLPYQVESQGLKFILVLISYLLFYTVQTIISTPYYALAAEISTSYAERTKVLTIRLLFSLISSGLCSILPGFILMDYSYTEMELVYGILTEVTKYAREGYMVLALIFGGVFTIFLLVTSIFIKERKDLPPLEPNAKIFRNIFSPLKIKVTRQYLTMQTLKCTCMAFMSTVVPFYVTYFLGRPNDLYFLLGAMFLAQVLALPLWSKLSQKTSKATTYWISCIVWIVAGIMLFFAVPTTSSIIIYALAFFMGIGICGVVLMPNSMFGDMGDVGELKFGDRREGIFAAFESISFKIASAIATPVVMLVLGFTGFEAQPYNNDSALAIRIMLTLSPIVFLAAGMVVALKYKLDSKMHNRLKNVLEDKRNGINDTEEEKLVRKELL